MDEHPDTSEDIVSTSDAIEETFGVLLEDLGVLVNWAVSIEVACKNGHTHLIHLHSDAPRWHLVGMLMEAMHEVGSEPE